MLKISGNEIIKKKIKKKSVAARKFMKIILSQ